MLDLLKFRILRVLRNVTVVVTDHLDEEGFGLIGALLLEDASVDHVDNLLAVVLKLLLNLLLVCKERFVKLSILRVLLNGGNGAASSAFARNQVLEGNREKVALVRVHSASLGN